MGNNFGIKLIEYLLSKYKKNSAIKWETLSELSLTYELNKPQYWNWIWFKKSFQIKNSHNSKNKINHKSKINENKKESGSKIT